MEGTRKVILGPRVRGKVTLCAKVPDFWAGSQDFEAFRCKGLTKVLLGPRVREQVILSPRVQDNYAPAKKHVKTRKKSNMDPKVS